MESILAFLNLARNSVISDLAATRYQGVHCCFPVVVGIIKDSIKTLVVMSGARNFSVIRSESSAVELSD